VKMTLAEISAGLGATPVHGEAAWIVPRRVQTDSRVAEPGDLFVCIRGERFDGHEFALKAVAKGAVALVTDRAPDNFSSDLDVPVLQVNDSIEALGRLAAYHRSKTQACVIGVTGTAGKTTVKEMIASICSLAGATARNHKNLNNQIGLPLSMLEANGDERYWVFEIGISEAKDMDELGAILNPDVAVIVNVGAAHLEGLGDVTGVARHKSRLFHYLRTEGVGLYSLDYPELCEAAVQAWPRVVGFTSRGREARFAGEYVEPAEAERGRYRMRLGPSTFMVEVPWRGEFAAENCIAAAATAYLAGIEPATVKRGLEASLPSEQRFACRKVGQVVLVDDTYNANPLSMAATMRGAADLAEGKPLVLVLGEMRELGAAAAQAHEEVGRTAGSLNPLAVFWRGGHACDVARGLQRSGYARLLAEVESPASFLTKFKSLDLRSGVVFFKGSRATRMEELSDPLLKELQQ